MCFGKKGRPFEIPDASEMIFPFFRYGIHCRSRDGVYKGEFTEKFYKAGLFMHAVDPWLAYKNLNTLRRILQARRDIKRFLIRTR